MFPLGVGAAHSVPQHPGFDRPPALLARQGQFRHLVEGRHRTQPPVGRPVGVVRARPEALLHGLAGQAQLVPDRRPAVASATSGRDRPRQQFPGDLLGLGTP